MDHPTLCMLYAFAAYYIMLPIADIAMVVHLPAATS